ncbi:hypothetical protein [Nocardioides mesophilus]|uniref:Uncharacterized protein n=1 Tax=Nocardioides mesophilus TaxID=433659 RepID=A0A7G9R827_9ACTN|nr:hypothetical protein [Nocardioides mesophilus]QNN51752.1 hypothetical protein H9L09_14475 [Nocardioides mesophilus]
MLFIALSVVSVTLAATLLVADTLPVWAVSVVVNALAVTAYVVSRATALPHLGDDVGNWTEPLGMAAVLAETISILIAVSVLVQRVPRRWTLWSLAAATVLVTAGCSTATAGGEEQHTMPDGSRMSDSAMSSSATATDSRPSESAQMICSGETRDAVVRTFQLSDPPASSSTWSHQVFSCTYQLPEGDLKLSVHDATDEASGTTYFAQTRAEFDDADSIDGMQNFGLPAFQTTDGVVVFLKDGKTLRVDATGLSASAFPPGFSAEQSAYSVAAAVIACWSE